MIDSDLPLKRQVILGPDTITCPVAEKNAILNVEHNLSSASFIESSCLLHSHGSKSENTVDYRGKFAHSHGTFVVAQNFYLSVVPNLP